MSTTVSIDELCKLPLFAGLSSESLDRLAELLQGSLELESQPGKGSTFTLTLPASADARATRVPDQELPKRTVDDRRPSQTDAAAIGA